MAEKSKTDQPDSFTAERAAALIRGLAASGDGRIAAAYHNTAHTAHVAVIAAYLAGVNEDLAKIGGIASLELKDRLLLVLAALAHDIDHPGRGSPPENPVFNEERSFAAVKPLLEAA